MSTTHLVRDSVRAVPTLRFRRTFMTVESLVALGGLVGTGMLLTGTNTPPVGTIEPLGLSSWVLPGGWLFATTVIPSVVATVLAWRGSPHTPTAVLVASATLAIELLVQIPFLGPSPFQAVFGGIAVTMVGLDLPSSPDVPPAGLRTAVLSSNAPMPASHMSTGCGPLACAGANQVR